MRFSRKRSSGRFKAIGFISDLAMVGAAAMRVARRPSGGAAARSGGRSGPGEWFLVAGAALRLLRRIRRVRKDRRVTATND